MKSITEMLKKLLSIEYVHTLIHLCALISILGQWMPAQQGFGWKVDFENGPEQIWIFYNGYVPYW